MSRTLCHALAACLLATPLVAGHAGAQTDPLDSGLFVFPVTSPSPSSARSAGFAMADRWLADEANDNPAAAGRMAMSVSPMLQRLSRQDLRARTQEYDETAAFLDTAGGWFRASLSSRLSVTLYAQQPTLRREESAFTFGEEGAPTPPIPVRSTTDSREIRAGAALAWRHGGWSLGVAPEWTHRSDHFTRTIESGSPQTGTSSIEFDGDGVGGQLGLRYAMPATQLGGLTVGLAARYVPELALDGTLVEDDGFSSTEADVAATRESAWEGGVSVASHLGEAWRLVAGFGGRTAMAWQGFDVANGRATQLGVGVEFRDPANPWSIRAGYGRESNPGTAEPTAGVLGLGFGWIMQDLVLDFGLLHRSLEHPDDPTSYDDRVVGSVTYTFGAR